MNLKEILMFTGNRRWIWLLGIAIVLLALAACVAPAQENEVAAPQVEEELMETAGTVVFFLAQDETDQGWNAAHMRGIREMAAMFGEMVIKDREANRITVQLTNGAMLEIYYVENLFYTDADIERKMRAGLAEYKPDLVFATWWDSQGAAVRLANEFPDTRFVHISGYPVVASDMSPHGNFSTLFSRMEDSDYVAGYALGLTCNPGNEDSISPVGLVGTWPIPEPIRAVNWFTWGLQHGMWEAGCDPEMATVDVAWINSWLDASAEAEAANAFVAQGYPVIRQLPDTPTTSQVACENGVIAIGYGADVTPTAPCALLTNEWGWAAIYGEFVEADLNGVLQAQDWYGGWESGVMNMVWGEMLPADVVAKAESMIDAMRQGYDPACSPTAWGTPLQGRMLETGEQVTFEDGHCLTDMERLNMMWIVDAVNRGK